METVNVIEVNTQVCVVPHDVMSTSWTFTCVVWGQLLQKSITISFVFVALM